MTAVNRYYSSTAVDTTLAVGISASATSLTVSSTTGFPTSYPYTLAIDYDTSKEELVNVVGASGTTLTVGTTVGVADITGRGVDQGAGYRVAHDAGAVVKHVISGRDVREPQEHIAATTSVHGIADTSALVTASSTTVLTNKSLTAPVITGVADVTAGTLALGTTGSITANSATLSAAELSTLDGISTSSTIATQLGTKAPIASPTFTGTVTIPTGAQITTPTISGGTISTPTINGDGTLSGSLQIFGNTAVFKIADTVDISSTEISYLNNVTSAIQTQLDSKPTVKIQSGSSTTSTTANGTLITQSVSFTTPFTSGTTPVVTVTPIRSFSSASSLVQMTLNGNPTASGFTVQFINNTGSTIALPFNWIAVGS